MDILAISSVTETVWALAAQAIPATIINNKIRNFMIKTPIISTCGAFPADLSPATPVWFEYLPQFPKTSSK